MADDRPKLLILGGPSVDAEALRRSLADLYDVVVVDPSDAHERLARDSVNAVFSGAEDLPTLWTAIGREKASILLDAIGEGVLLTNTEGERVWSNAFISDLDERTRERVRSLCREAGNAYKADPANNDIEVTELVTDKGGKSYEVTISPVRMPGEPAQVAAVLRDVTDHARRERQLEAINRAGHELLSIDTEAIRKATMVQRLKMLEDRIVRFNHEILHFDHFVIFLIDETEHKLELVISQGLPQEIEDLTLKLETEGSGISGWVASTGKSYICDDATSDERFLPGLAGAQSSLTVPLRLHEKVVGIMDIESKHANAFSDEDRRFAEIFGRYIAVALHMLDLLVAERSTTNESITGRVVGELDEPLEDILAETDYLSTVASQDPETARHIARIKSDVEAIRRRVKNVAQGPQTLLGVEKELAEKRRDPFLAGRRVLVADDASKIRRILSDVLSNRGCQVTLCESGGEAIDVLERWKAGEVQPFDLIISDIKMPDRNGYELFAAARRVSDSVPVILMTGFGYDPHHSIVRASQEGLQAVLFKPFQIEQLIDEVRKAVTPEAANHEA